MLLYCAGFSFQIVSDKLVGGLHLLLFVSHAGHSRSWLHWTFNEPSSCLQLELCLGRKHLCFVILTLKLLAMQAAEYCDMLDLFKVNPYGFKLF